MIYCSLANGETDSRKIEVSKKKKVRIEEKVHGVQLTLCACRGIEKSTENIRRRESVVSRERLRGKTQQEYTE